MDSINSNNIKGKNILLICYPFFGFDQIINDTLYKLGANYVYFKQAKYFPGSPLDEHFWQPIYRGLLYYLKNPDERTQWTEQLKNEIKDYKFDYLLCIENTPFKKSFLDWCKKKNPGIKTVWFLWDTFKTQQKWHRGYIPYFDKVYTFDRDDALKYNIEYFPNFYYIPQIKNKYQYNVSFIGSANPPDTSFRIDCISKIKKQCDALNLNTFFYVKTYIISVNNPIKKIFRKMVPYEHNIKINKHKDEGFLYDKSLSLSCFFDIMSGSDIIVDVGYSGRQGMTLNAIFAIASGKKLVTTNYRIKDEVFYHPSNILVVDEHNPIIPKEFIDSPIHTIDMSCLRVDNWLKHLLNV